LTNCQSSGAQELRAAPGRSGHTHPVVKDRRVLRHEAVEPGPVAAQALHDLPRSEGRQWKVKDGCYFATGLHASVCCRKPYGVDPGAQTPRREAPGIVSTRFRAKLDQPGSPAGGASLRGRDGRRWRPFRRYSQPQSRRRCTVSTGFRHVSTARQPAEKVRAAAMIQQNSLQQPALQFYVSGTPTARPAAARRRVGPPRWALMLTRALPLHGWHLVASGWDAGGPSGTFGDPSYQPTAQENAMELVTSLVPGA
jgi:hypothetical protein